MVQSHNPDLRKAYKTDDPIYYLHSYGLDIQNNEIYLFGREDYSYGSGEVISEPGVEYTMANQFIKNIRTLQLHSNKPILVHLKTCGGFWEEGMAIYDAIRACPNPVTILNYTHARSMSSLIFLAADQKVMMPYSTYMIHEGTFGFEGTQKQLRTEYRATQKTMDQMLDIYVEALSSQGKYSDKPEKWIRNWVKRQMNDHEEVYFDAEEAVEVGFADYVFGSDGTYDWRYLKQAE